MVKTILTTISSILRVIIMVVHMGIYRKTGTKFSLRLVIYSATLLLYAVSSNPLLHQVLGFRRI